MVASLLFALPTVVALLLGDRLLHRSLRAGVGATANAAARVVDAAQVFGVFLLAIGAATGSRADVAVADDVAWVAINGCTGLLAFELAAWLGTRALLGGAVRREVRAGNVAAATLAAGHVVATGILAASLFGGHSADELLLGTAFFALAQVSLHVLVAAFRLLTTYDDDAEVREQNHGAALAHAGLSVAVALLVAHAADGPYTGLLPSLQAYGVALAEGALFYVVRQGVVECALLGARPRWRGGELDRAIGERGDIGAGALEAATYLATAFLIRSLG